MSGGRSGETAGRWTISCAGLFGIVGVQGPTELLTGITHGIGTVVAGGTVCLDTSAGLGAETADNAEEVTNVVITD